MSDTHRRYELLLPRKFNDGSAVPEELLGLTVRELQARFGPVSYETQSIRGTWPAENGSQGGETRRDELVRVFVDVADLPEHRDFFSSLKPRLKERFQQEDIWITPHPLEIL